MTQKTAADWIRQKAGSVSGWHSPVADLSAGDPLRTFVACEARVRPRAGRGYRVAGYAHVPRNGRRPFLLLYFAPPATRQPRPTANC